MRKPDPIPQSSKRASIASSYDEPPVLSSRTSSSATTDADGETAAPPAAGSMKRKKSRAYTPPDEEEESEGAQADAEFGGIRTSAWGSLDGRRRSVHSSGTRRVEADDVRRHSMAV